MRLDKLLGQSVSHKEGYDFKKRLKGNFRGGWRFIDESTRERWGGGGG